MWPIDRLLRSMREHPQYTPEDSRWLCLGYAPRARLLRENADDTNATDDDADADVDAPASDPEAR
jgi:hypothetical protein